MENSIINNNDNLFIVIMAGGLGKRMNSSLPKVLHCINNIPMLVRIINNAKLLNPTKILIVVGIYKEIIYSTLIRYMDIETSNIEFIFQKESLGTGNAILCCKNYIESLPSSNVLILSGDIPLIQYKLLQKIIDSFQKVTIVTTKFENPFGYGRIIFNKNVEEKEFKEIKEEKDCSDNEKKINLVNAGIYMIDSNLLCKYITYINNYNNQKEYYLTDIFAIIKLYEDININLFEIEKKDQYQIDGVNTQEQLNKINEIFCSL